jgi:NHLM bacteriocin system ABC transporter peptidase/ATP-binding protein
MQMEALECGAASLAMVMAYHGKWVPLEQVRSDCGVSRDGSNAKNILQAARAYGFSAQAFRTEPEQLKEMLPCIIHWNFNHFVVFCGFKRKSAIINDPGRGRVEIPPDEFNRSFTGVALTFEPGEAFAKGGRKSSVWGFARSRMKGMLIPAVFIVISMLILSIIDMVNPVFSRIFIDRVLSGRNADWLNGLILVMLAAVLIRFIVTFLQTVYFTKMKGKFAAIANGQFLWHVLRLPMEFFSQRMAGDIVARMSSNQTISVTLLDTVVPQALNVVMLFFYLIIMIRYSLPLTLIGVAAVGINIAVAQLISQKRVAIARVQASHESKLICSTIAGIDMIETLKASGAENGYFERWAGFQASANAAAVRFTRTNQIMGNLPFLVQKLSEITLLGLGAYLIIQGSMTAGIFLAFQGFLGAFMRPANSLLVAGQSIQEMRTNMERVEDVLHYPTDRPPLAPKPDAQYHKLSGGLAMKDVSFGYSKLAPPLIEHFDLELKPGASVAFVGSSGCGKSTLAKLISGLYKPWSGEICFDDVNVEDIPHAVITGSLAVVDQDITIFQDSISNNIKMWDTSIEDFEMILAAKDAQIHEDVMLREKGYGYPVLEDGKDFSGGQRQRLEIARLLAQDPTIIILDEATSALDAQTEHEVVEAIKRRDITCIFVAHRLSTIRDCDEIIVMDKGAVVERGTHEQLLANEGLYKRLITTE